MNKKRLDILLVEKQLVKSRERAKKLILSKSVYVNGILSSKPSMLTEETDQIKINDDDKYVSRGAYKLDKAIKKFCIELEDKIAIDIGASTGGFTDIMLKNGCKKVYAIDVGHSQLEESLRVNSKVVNLEKTNFRYINTKVFVENIDFVSIDVSFISLSLILPKVSEICNNNTQIVALIKPQFEAGKKNVGKHGIVKDKKVHAKVIKDVYTYCENNDLHVLNLTFSPIAGGNGNIEYLVHLKSNKNNSTVSFVDSNLIENVVKDAFNNLKN